jgi:threonine dehydrogenase-like Zn-dependent dehydrogenase
MRALEFDGAHAQLRELPEPACGRDEALVHVRLAGVCDTDLELVRGYRAFRGVLGHEFVGEVDASDASELAGRRVVADINLGCGECGECLRAGGHHCTRRRVVGIHGHQGAFAERLALPRRNLVALPDTLDDARAVFAEPLAAALHVLDELPAAREGEGEAIVIGDGKLGLLVALALHGAGMQTRVIGHHADKLARVARCGVATLLEHELGPTPERSAALVVEASGSASGLALALALARPRGCVIMKTTRAAPLSIDLAPLVIHELRLVGSRCGDMRRAVATLAAGTIDPRPLVDARFPLSRADEALVHAGERGRLKVLIDPRMR